MISGRSLVISLVSTNGYLVMKDVPFSGAPMLVRLKKKSPRIANRKLGPDDTFRKGDFVMHSRRRFIGGRAVISAAAAVPGSIIAAADSDPDLTQFDW
jgi:hypothetical protein